MSVCVAGLLVGVVSATLYEFLKSTLCVMFAVISICVLSLGKVMLSSASLDDVDFDELCQQHTICTFTVGLLLVCWHFLGFHLSLECVGRLVPLPALIALILSAFRASLLKRAPTPLQTLCVYFLLHRLADICWILTSLNKGACACSAIWCTNLPPEAWVAQLVIAATSFLHLLLLFGNQIVCASLAKGPRKSLSMCWYQMMYSFDFGYGILWVARAIQLSYYTAEGSWITTLMAMKAVCWMGPSLLILCFGSTFVFHWKLRHFNADVLRLQQDGAFIAELLDHTEVKIGENWWMHQTIDNKDTRYDANDRLHNWKKGIVVKISGQTMHVAVRRDCVEAEQEKRTSIISTGSLFSAEREILQLPLPSGGLACSDLLQQARTSLRCIDWENITWELISGAPICGPASMTAQASLFKLSRPVRVDETIDFFISHSWYDDAKRKFAALQQIACHFKRMHLRYPTFWFDKVCVDQAKISEALKVLPVHIMSCKTILVLFGETYLSRLWCAWELSTVMSFTGLEQALERVHVHNISGSTTCSARQHLMNFESRVHHAMIPMRRGSCFMSLVCLDGAALKSVSMHSARRCKTWMTVTSSQVLGFEFADLLEAG